MIYNTLDTKTETIGELLGLTKERGGQLYNEIHVATEQSVKHDITNMAPFFNKNAYINNALQFAKTENEVRFVLYHMGGFMESLQNWLEKNNLIVD